MRVLLTGGSGFLGKEVLELLIADERIKRIDVLSRSKKSHPDPKVRIIPLDLSMPESLPLIPSDITAVLHLAGLYDFKRDAVSNYTNNVLTTSNLVEHFRSQTKGKKTPILAASSYVVGLGCPEEEAEKRTSQLPPSGVAYAYTKALSEKLLIDSELPCTIFRLGILVGSSSDGSIEKIEGPYYLMSALSKLSRLRLPFKKIPLPVPGNPDQVLPLVPVNFAAQAFHEALFKEDTFKEGVRIFGVYRAQGTTLRELCVSLVHELAPAFYPIFIGKLSSKVASRQTYFTGIPRDAITMASDKIALGSKNFEKHFPEIQIPSFEIYKSSFIRGFIDATSGPTSHSTTQGRTSLP